MSNKNYKPILNKLGIESLNPMQIEASKAISDKKEVVVLSPTGTGKTLAFLLPILKFIDPKFLATQVLVVVPTRELAIQIEQVARNMGSGHKVNAVYGGRSGAKDKIDLKHPPSILIGTPGRIADHIKRRNIVGKYVKTLILDEFDKSLEVGFRKEMKEILSSLYNLQHTILTSATHNVEIPSFIKLEDPTYVNYSDEGGVKLTIKSVASPTKDKLATLANLLRHHSKGSGIVFCNFKDSINYVSEYLTSESIDHTAFYGGMEQIDRERALIKFRNGTHNILLATDLAARGIDVPSLDYIIHYQIPPNETEFTHRNGRTARMHKEGTAYVLHWKEEKLYDFITDNKPIEIEVSNQTIASEWTTLFISGGRKDKISKGDIAGLFFKQGDLTKDQLGIIELKSDCAFVSVKKAVANQIIDKLNNQRLKKKKVRIYEID
jgi:superfamily II DNA/RNA helicase